MARSRGPNHPQKRVGNIRVDEKMAPLLRLVWKAGIETMSSCQGDEGYPAHITFMDLEPGLAFVEYSAGLQGPGPSWGSPLGGGEPSDRWTIQSAWIDGAWSTHITFPPAHIARLTEIWRSLIDAKVFDQ